MAGLDTASRVYPTCGTHMIAELGQARVPLPSTTLVTAKTDVDARPKAGHDDGEVDPLSMESTLASSRSSPANAPPLLVFAASCTRALRPESLRDVIGHDSRGPVECWKAAIAHDPTAQIRPQRNWSLVICLVIGEHRSGR